VTNREQCDALVASYTAGWSTAALDERLAAVGIPAAQLGDTADLAAHPQLSERDRWRTVSTEAGDIEAVLPPMTFRDVELPMGPVPALGEHTDAILGELGG
jgi:formyl-CoA transferase